MLIIEIIIGCLIVTCPVVGIIWGICKIFKTTFSSSKTRRFEPKPYAPQSKTMLSAKRYKKELRRKRREYYTNKILGK